MRSPSRMRKNAPYDQKTVIPAAAKRRAGIQKPLKCLDSRFRGNDDKSSSIASFRAVSEFFRTLLGSARWVYGPPTCSLLLVSPARGLDWIRPYPTTPPRPTAAPRSP
jgi:hypothetical protein